MKNVLLCTYSNTFWLWVHSLVPKSYRKTKKIQIMQNKFTWFSHRLDKMQCISLTEFRSINWLPTKERNAITFRFVNNNCPFYRNEIFEFFSHCRINTRNSLARPKHLFTRLTQGRKSYYTLVPVFGIIYLNPLKKWII